MFIQKCTWRDNKSQQNNSMSMKYFIKKKERTSVMRYRSFCSLSSVLQRPFAQSFGRCCYNQECYTIVSQVSTLKKNDKTQHKSVLQSIQDVQSFQRVCLRNTEWGLTNCCLFCFGCCETRVASGIFRWQVEVSRVATPSGGL